MMGTDLEYAQTAWAAYVQAVGNTTYDGRPMPTWDQLGDRQREGWKEAAKAVVSKAIRTQQGV